MKTTKEMIEVMSAYKNGKQIEWFDDILGEWKDTKNPMWDWEHIDYRVKEESKYRPYKDIEEMINDFCERSGAKRSKMGEPFIWIKHKNGKDKHLITGVYDEGVYNSSVYLELEEMLRDYCYLDDSPCGKLED